MHNRGLWIPCRRPTGRSQLLYRYIKATCAGHAGHQLHRNHACHNATLCSIGLHDDNLLLCASLLIVLVTAQPLYVALSMHSKATTLAICQPCLSSCASIMAPVLLA